MKMEHPRLLKGENSDKKMYEEDVMTDCNVKFLVLMREKTSFYNCTIT